MHNEHHTKSQNDMLGSPYDCLFIVFGSNQIPESEEDLIDK